jgi:hypothetical protein
MARMRIGMRVAAAVAATVILAWTGAGQASSAGSDKWSMLEAGFGLGPIGGFVSVDGRKAQTLGPALAGAVEVGYGRAVFTRTIGALGLLRAGTWPDRWSVLEGEQRYRVDLAVGVGARWPLGGVNGGERSLLAALVLGPTVNWIDTPVHVAISERYSVGAGFNAGARVRLALPIWGAHSAFLALDNWCHVAWLSRHTSILETAHAGTERYRFVDLQALLVVGYELEL